MKRREPRPWSVLVTVEHGGNQVPEELSEAFRGFEPLLESHRGWDPGALDLGRALAGRLQATLVGSHVTRLLVDLNRSPGNRAVFSAVTRPLPKAVRDDLIRRFHRPHREAVERHVARAAASGSRVLHLGVHSFTPVLDGQARAADVGILYDPGRARETALAARIASRLKSLLPEWVVRRNYPYRGSSDGLVTVLRMRFDDADYAGLEIEVSQARLSADGRFPEEVTVALAEAVTEALADGGGSAL